ncbi:hypothetical protein BLNAU_25081 [Blattamonas nauphoetae]|uniref:Uncharacterized protein n=1 Tax=Blattamonas nauphoetae TaxID=2049346 RepID=A0ABQ9WKM4_9EUKA|nr:hypothetical protein BLNAU_25081 [Blattamonas nauphoetae]
MQKPTRRTFSLDVTAEPHPEVREAELNELLWTLGIAVWCSSSNTPHREREFSWKQWRDSHRPEKQRGCRRTPTSKDLANRRVHIALFTSPEHKDGTNQRECSTPQPHNLFFFIRIVTSGTLQLTRRSQIVGAEKAPLLTVRIALVALLLTRCWCARLAADHAGTILVVDDTSFNFTSTRTQCLDFVLISGHGNCVSDPTTRRCVRHETWQFVISDTRHFVFLCSSVLHIACLISSDEGTLIVSNWNGREREEEKEKDEREEKSEIMRPVSQFTPLSFISVCSVSVHWKWVRSPKAVGRSTSSRTDRRPCLRV